jgi:sugar lactone lactonase YvrE
VGTTKPEPFGKVTLGEGDFGVLGLATDADGNVYGAVQSKPANGLWKFDAATGDATRIEGSEAIGFPNDVAVTPDGDVYVASSTEGKDAADVHQGGIWKVGADGKATKWLVNTDLGGTGSSGLPVPIGANGIEFHDGSLYVTVTEKARILAFPINDDGTAGSMRVVAEGDQLAGADGLDLDPVGNVFVAVIAQQKIVRVATDATITEIAVDADGLDYPSSLQFGVGDKADTLYVVNFAIGELLGAKTVEGPALLSIPPSA